jgi:transposase-like protein/IS1 family transposase
MQKLVVIVEGLILLLLWMFVWGHCLHALLTRWRGRPQRTKREWAPKPRTPDDCPTCRLEQRLALRDTQRTARAWRDVKSRQGRPKTHDTDGQACMEPSCEYYKDTDGTHHALRWDGTRNKSEATPSVECGACGSKHTMRLGTPMYRLKTTSERVALATHLAMKGMSVADISEVLGHSEETVTRWLARSGQHSEGLHERLLRNLVVVHIQLDELVGKVRRGGQRLWVWTSEDALSKAWLVWYVGQRPQADAHRVVHRVAQRLAKDCVPVFSSDGLRQYFYALTAHFGQWTQLEGKRRPVWQVLPDFLYGQLRKIRSGYRLKYVHTKMLCGTRAQLTERLQPLGLSGQIQTAFIERLNLTLRHLVAALRRRTWALAHTGQGLRWRVALAAGYYNFCRPHHALRVPLGHGRFRHRTPAMALDVTGHCWTVQEFILHPVYG